MEFTRRLRVRGRVSFRGATFESAAINKNAGAGGNSNIYSTILGYQDPLTAPAGPGAPGIQAVLKSVFRDGYNYFFFEGNTKNGNFHAKELNEVIEVDGDEVLKYDGGVRFSDDDSLMEDNPQIKRVAKYALKALDTVSNLLGPKKSI